MSETDRDEGQSGGAGRDGLVGYEYQMDVSVWLALDLLLANKQAHELVLEPATQEDLEGNLEESEPGRATGELRVNNYRLVVQAKLRSGDAWSVAAIKALLAYGSEKRISAAQRLADPGVRYLLVSSAPLSGEAKGLGVGIQGCGGSPWKCRSLLPTRFLKVLPGGSQ